MAPQRDFIVIPRYNFCSQRNIHQIATLFSSGIDSSLLYASFTRVSIFRFFLSEALNSPAVLKLVVLIKLQMVMFWAGNRGCSPDTSFTHIRLFYFYFTLAFSIIISLFDFFDDPGCSMFN